MYNRTSLMAAEPKLRRFVLLETDVGIAKCFTNAAIQGKLIAS